MGLLYVSTAGVLWGTGGLVATLLHNRDGLGAMTTSAWRMLLAAVAVLLFLLATRRWRTLVTTFRTHPLLAVAVGSGTAIYQGLYFVSVLMVGVSVSTVVALGLAPVLTAAWEHATRRTLPTPRDVTVLVAALTGLVVVSLGADHVAPTSGGNTALGIGLAVLSGATYAATTVLGHHLAVRVDAVSLNACATTAGAVVLAPFLAFALVTDEPVLPGDAASWALLLYLGVATMALAYGLLYLGLRTTSGSAATVATLLEPVSAALLAAALLGERLTWVTVAGGILILSAVVALRPPPEEPAPPPV
ncbi:EamA family transporter [Mycobacterium sp. MS1601]|uniref:DMT family transporter n=1 Tax=Mycobacterium sp. MS1601 TaxID=1936029 RepID=UPI0009790B22|nr:DMT family transporter [Mycobacterium sp. MS1601]AQA04008.1 EamA family transporter [Mycobacterium sp. MS1601]